MYIYILIIILLYLHSFQHFKKYSKIIYWVWVCILAIVSGIRYYVGMDFQIQIDYYNWTLAGRTKSWLEPGFRLYVEFVDRIFGNFQMYIFIASLFVIFSFGYAISIYLEQKYWFLGLALFVTSTIYFATMNLERQYIATAFLVLSLSFFEKKRYIPVVILTFLAINFHQSAICFLLYYALYTWLNWKDGIYFSERLRILNVLVLFSIVGMIVDFRSIVASIGVHILPSKYANYLTSRFFLNRNMDSILKYIVPDLIWIFLLRKPRNLCSNKISLFLPGYFLWIFINNFFYGINVMLRIGMYFEWMLLFVFSYTVQMGKNRNVRVQYKAFILFYYLSLTCYSIFYSGGHGVVPYRTFFQ